MRLPNLAGAFVIAMMVAASLHVTAKPAAADTTSICATLSAAEIRVAGSRLSAYAKALALAAITSAKQTAGCTN